MEVRVESEQVFPVPAAQVFAEGAEILVAAVRRPGGPQGDEIQLVFVEPPDGAPAVWVDGDGDGVISENILTPERAIADDEQVVFRLGSRYVSFESADRASGVFTLRAHPRADYARIELVVGQQMTDFRFRDFEGRERRLSDFRGKFLLLDFWGTWCGPCVRAIPDLKAAYEKFRERGFEILGVDHRDEFEEVRAFVAEREMDWPEVRPEDGDSLVRERFRIIAYPTYVLLDPEGTMVFVGHALQGALLQTLEEVLPPAQARGTVTETIVG